jgi:hypothetical protein
VTVNYSNTVFLTVLPPPSLEGVGWTVRVLSERDYVSPVALVERFSGLGFTVDANAEGGGTVSLDSDDGIFKGALPVGESTRLQDQEALWQVLEDGQVRFEFLAEDVDEDIIPSGGGPRQTVIAGRGTASVLEWAPVLPEGMPTPTSMARTFNAHPMAVWVQLFEEAQAEGFLEWVNLSFDAAADSAAEPWGGPQALTVNAGDTLLDLLKRWADANELSWRMLPGFTLEVRQTPGSHLEDTVVFTQYRSQGEHKRKITRRELANVVYADSGDNGLAVAADTDSATKWRKRAAWVSAGDASDASARSAVANVTLGLAKDQRLSRTLKLLPDREGRHPFVDFNVHDWVGVEVPDDDTESGARQVMGLAVDIDADGVVQYEATLQSRFEVRAVKMQRLLDKLGASERSGSGGAAASPITVTKAMSVVRLEELADVDLTAPGTGSLLQWNGARWVDVVGNLDLLADVSSAGADAPADGDALVYDGGAGLWKPGSAGGGGGSSTMWETVLDLPGTTFNTTTDWTVGTGTWASNGTEITQTSTSGTSRAYLKKKMLTGAVIVDIEIMILAQAGADTQAGVVVANTGTGTGGTLYRLHMTNATPDKVEVEQDAVRASLQISMNWGGLNVWKKLRCVQFGNIASVYLDGVLLGTASNAIAPVNGDGTYIGLKTNTASVKFRNLKVWNPSMPALP